MRQGRNIHEQGGISLSVGGDSDGARRPRTCFRTPEQFLESHPRRYFCLLSPQDLLVRESLRASEISLRVVVERYEASEGRVRVSGVLVTTCRCCAC